MVKQKKVSKKMTAKVDMAKEKTKTAVSTTSTSPVPKKKIQMLSFYDALREVTEGKKLTRVAWNDVGIYVYLRGDYLEIFMGGKTQSLIVSRGDIDGIDWYVIPEQEKKIN